MQDEPYLKEIHIAQEYQEIDRVERHRQTLMVSEIERLKGERDALAKAIRDAALRAKIINPDCVLTGPELIMLCDDLADGWEKK